MELHRGGRGPPDQEPELQIDNRSQELRVQGYSYVIPVNYIRIDDPEYAGEDTEYKGLLFPETFSANRFSVKKCRVDVPKQFECLEGPIKKYYNSKDGYYTVQTLSDSESEEDTVQRDLGNRAAPLGALEYPEFDEGKCKLCGQRATTKEEMVAHLRWKHGVNPRYLITCSHCQYKSLSEFGMEAHMKLEHGPCLVCGYTPLPNDTFDCTVLHGGIASKSTVMILDSTPGQGQGGGGSGGGVQCITIDSDSDAEEDKLTQPTTLREKSRSRSRSIISVTSLSSND